MKRNLLTAALVISAAAALTGCTGAASATPATTAAATPAAEPSPTASASAIAAATKSGDPLPPPPGPGVTGAVDPEWAAFEQARNVVTSLVQGQKLSAAEAMTPEAAQDMKSEDLKNYMFGGRTLKTCQIGKSPLKVKDSVLANIARDTPGSSDSRISAVEVACDSVTFGYIVRTVGPENLVDNIDRHVLPDSYYFVGN
jgi:hypothetical protein